MTAFIDIPVLVAAMVGSEELHAICLDRMLTAGKRTPIGIYQHGIAETFSTLTCGKKKGIRMPAGFVADLLEDDFVPKLSIFPLHISDTIRAMHEAHSRGVRGGSICDYLHLVAARKAKARRICTLNVSDFRAFHRAGDPVIALPGD